MSLWRLFLFTVTKQDKNFQGHLPVPIHLKTPLFSARTLWYRPSMLRNVLFTLSHPMWICRGPQNKIPTLNFFQERTSLEMPSMFSLPAVSLLFCVLTVFISVVHPPRCEATPLLSYFSWEEVSHSSVNLSDHLTRQIGNKTMVSGV